MAEEVYRQLCDTMARRGGRYPGVDIPEFYAVAEELFTPEEAAICNAMPRGFNTAETIAAAMGKTEQEVAPVLEAMADKGLVSSARKDGERVYGGPPFVPGIFEFQFMRGTFTERDRKLARLILAYEKALDSGRGPTEETFPATRVITVDRAIMAGNEVHTYDQLVSYIEKYEPLSLSTCYCRHAAKLVDEKDDCGMPDDVCMQFGTGAQFIIDRKMGRQITKEEALEVLRKSEEAGLVHTSANRQEIDYICNCCSCHCVALRNILSKPKPGLALNSGFHPVWDAELCTACGICIDRCPAKALVMGEEDLPVVNLERCIGCGVCATGCPEGAIGLVERPGIPIPPVDQKALKAAIMASRAA